MMQPTITRAVRPHKSRRKNKYLGSALAVLCAGIMLVSGCNGVRRQPIVPQPTAPLEIDGSLEFLDQDEKLLASISIEIAETIGARMMGLMDRHSLHPMHGMLFIFDTSELKGFWMHRTYIPLDIIFVDADKQIVNIAENTTPHSREAINSGEPVLYVVEVNAGFVKRFNISDRSRIQWKRE
ncbi:MAG: DUF192 domain-containing protein [Desulfobacterales bacterium]